MKAQAYLETRLKNCSRYRLTDQDEEYLEKSGISDFIFKKLTSKKFRKWAINEESEKNIREALKINIDNNEPIKFTYPFGGYKLWRLPTSPEVDWAEFLAIAYYCKYVAPVLQVYQPGVEFLFSSDDLIIERMNNILRQDTDKYFDSFTVLLKEFSKYFPQNMKMEIKRVSDLYQPEELEEELSGHIERLRKEYPDMDKTRKEAMLKTSELNINFQGKDDLTAMPIQDKQEKLMMGTIYHDAQCSLSRRRDLVRGKDKIVIFTTKIPNAIPIGTTKASVTKFWTGFGILEKNAESFKDRILSPRQLTDLEKNNLITEQTDLIDLKNLKEIKIMGTANNLAKNRN